MRGFREDRVTEKQKPDFVRNFCKRESGSMSVEFAMIAPILFALVFSALEAGVMYMKIAVIEMAMSDVTRQIYTGQAQNNSLTNTEVVNLLCGEIDHVVNCVGNITVQVEVLPGYSSSEETDPVCINAEDGEPEADDLPNYSNTVGGDIVYVRFCVTTNLIVPSLGNLTFGGTNIGLKLPETSDGKYAIVTTAIFRNEPFSTGSSQPTS